jgi:hypothetical protein
MMRKKVMTILKTFLYVHERLGALTARKELVKALACPIRFCTFPHVLEGLLLQRNQQEMRSPKLTPKRKRRIKTVLGQFRDKAAHFDNARTEIAGLESDHNTSWEKTFIVS